MNECEPDLSLQDDLTELAYDLTQSNFNVRQFKKSHATRPIKISSQFSQQRPLTRYKTQHNGQKSDDILSIVTQNKNLHQGFNKTLRYQETFIPPHKRNEHKFFSKPTAKSSERLSSITKEKNRMMASQQNIKLQTFEKQWSKGKIKEKCLEQWLNAILVQFCHDQYFDQNIKNSALKKLGVDENSLVAKGFPAKNVTRLYRGLFVFGMGFNELISQLTNSNMEATKIIWKIYSIVLEYCSKGGMQTVIGQIMRDNNAKVSQLTNEIVRRQEIIQKNEQLNQQKNNAIYREIKNLREDNINLNNEKTVLQQQYSTTDQAFTEEVNLRLKFETKINEIYGLHRQLGTKHQKLFRELSGKVEQLRVTADKYFQIARKTQQLKQIQLRLREQLIILKQKSKREGEYIQEMNKERVQLMGKICKLQFLLSENTNLKVQLQQKQNLWKNQIKNMQSMIHFRQKSAKETHSQYQITLQQNNRLYILLSDQRKVMEQYEKQKKNFNSKIISIVSENSFNKRKLEECEKKNNNLTEEIKNHVKKMEELRTQNDIKTKNQESYTAYMNNVEINVKEMRKINISNEQQLVFLRTFHKNMSKILADKHSTFQQLNKNFKTAVQEKDSLKIKYDELISRFTLLSERQETFDAVLAVKDKAIESLRQQIHKCEIQKFKKIQLMEDQLQKNRTLMEMFSTNLKNEKFQRNSLNTSYMQSLKMLQSKNNQQKKLNVAISLLQGEVEKQKNKYLVLQKNMIKMISQYATHEQKLQSTLEKQLKIIRERSAHIHPMIVEDLFAKLSRQYQANESNKKQLKQLNIKILQEIMVRDQLLEKTQKDHRWDMGILKRQSQKKIQNLGTQISYLTLQNADLKKKNQQYQNLTQIYKKKINQKATSQRQEVYKYMVEQKKKQIETMLIQMERLQDQLLKSKRQFAQLNASQRQKQDNHEVDNGKMLILKKELEHEFDMKFRDLQRSMRSEQAKKELRLKEESQNLIKNMTFEEILKIKEINADIALKEISVASKLHKQKQHEQQGNQKINRQVTYNKQMTKLDQDLQNRKTINRLLKNSFHYYQS